MKELSFKNKLRLGAVVGGVQSDGGKIGNGWQYWYSHGHIELSPENAAEHWERWREDTALMQSMGMTTCRLCVDWARIEPKQGRFSDEAIGHLAQELYQLRAAGIRPVLTLHRWSDPLWFIKKGGWENKENILCFLRYAEKLVRTIGHLVCEYLTFDEPNLHAINGYTLGLWPPGKKSGSATKQVMSVMASAHIRSYKLIHAVRRELGFDDTVVGCSVNMCHYDPWDRKNPLHKALAGWLDSGTQTAMAKAMLTGGFTGGLKNHALSREGIYADFAGLAGCPRVIVKNRSLEKNKREPYPEGIVHCARRLGEICNLPIYVTASGISDPTDEKGSLFIYEQLRAIAQADFPVERYYYRNLLDGFEWQGGSYGLAFDDPETGERRLKRSGVLFSAAIKSRGISSAVYDEYVRGGK